MVQNLHVDADYFILFFLFFSQLHDFWRLDYWEDDLRRRRRFVRNAFGSTHSDALLKAAGEYGQYHCNIPTVLNTVRIVIRLCLN